MKAIIVMPCLNEERVLLDTCRSLGFGAGVPDADDVSLVLVDNASTDNTARVMEQVRDASRPGTVFLEREEERGYVPPRHKGVTKAKEVAVASGLRDDQVLIVQADADTFYAPDYAKVMREAAEGVDAGVLLEGAMLPTDEFVLAHSGFVALSDEVDRAVERSFASDEDDVIVGDSVSAYLLSDYARWGGHVREYNHADDEMFAETSRLYIKGKLLGARREKIHAATAYPSRRKVFEDPGLYFATAGFPREMAWRARWRRAMPELKTMADFEHNDARTILGTEIEIRRLHLAFLFCVLPRVVAIAEGRTSSGVSETPIGAFVRSRLGSFGAEQVRANTGAVFGACLDLIEGEPAMLQSMLAQQ